ncbi:hypothetical protein JTB14_019729 [Gonioctena quinquepunctata]|nr:hypothetical protein JTB14_019729 [Gonioctena quinquepunctata]
MSSVRARKSLTSQAVVCLQVGDGGEEEPPEAMDMSWPSGARKRITYVLLAPIVFPLWLTLPDTRSPRDRCSLAETIENSSARTKSNIHSNKFFEFKESNKFSNHT